MDWIWYHALPLIVFGVPLIGFLWELLVGLLCRKNRWLLSLPVLAGALGLALCLLAQSSLSLSFLLGFWAAYGCALLFGWSLSQLRTTGDLRWKKWICRGMALCSGAALAVGFGVLILHEMRAANYTMVEEVISEENALSEIPELAITDTDRKILSALEASSSVQAAIGGVPLAMGLSCGNIVLTVAVTAILITAPLGAFLIEATYKKWLGRQTEILSR